MYASVVRPSLPPAQQELCSMCSTVSLARVSKVRPEAGSFSPPATLHDMAYALLDQVTRALSIEKCG